MKYWSKFTPFLLLSALLITACGPYWYKPYGRIFSHAPKDGNPGYRTGWIHGCESGLATQFGSAFMMSFYQWKKDPNLAIDKPDMNLVYQTYKDKWDINWNNEEEIKENIKHYRKVFWFAHAFCRHSIIGTYQTAADAYNATAMNPPLPGEQRFVPGKHNLGNIYSIYGRGNSQLVFW